jgi:3-phenylpropionate/trans-cinnamate dioxygenase ferredoxin reductase component
VRDNPIPWGVVIVGAGQAGGDLGVALRQQGYSGSICLIGDEAFLPYRRPPLSKQFLSGEVAVDSLYIRPAETYERLNIDCRFGIGVESIDRNGRVLRLFDGTEFAYEILVLATGGHARRLDIAGADHGNVHYVRNINDVVRLRSEFKPGRRLLIVGGGYIGLETAAVGVTAGLTVTLVESFPRVLARVTAPELSSFYEAFHRAKGVEIRTGVGVHALEGQELGEAVRLTDGMRLDVDVVVVGIGLIPNTNLAEAANLEVSNGIVVDAFTRTADPAIYAIGDCCNHENSFLGFRLRLESVPNATEQARICAATICRKPIGNAAVPWFWSDQYHLKLQMVGLSRGYDEIAIRGEMSSESFCAFYLKNGVVISADSVNRVQDFMIAKRMVAARVRTSVGQLVDETTPLKRWLP